MKLDPVDKDYVRWLDAKALARENVGNGKGDDIRPYGKKAFDANFDKIDWSVGGNEKNEN